MFKVASYLFLRQFMGILWPSYKRIEKDNLNLGLTYYPKEVIVRQKKYHCRQCSRHWAPIIENTGLHYGCSSGLSWEYLYKQSL